MDHLTESEPTVTFPIKTLKSLHDKLSEIEKNDFFLSLIPGFKTIKKTLQEINSDSRSSEISEIDFPLADYLRGLAYEFAVAPYPADTKSAIKYYKAASKKGMRTGEYALVSLETNQLTEPSTTTESQETSELYSTSISAKKNTTKNADFLRINTRAYSRLIK